MKLVVEKFHNKLGGDYLQEDEVEMKIDKVIDYIRVETEDSAYMIPIEVFRGILASEKGSNE